MLNRFAVYILLTAFGFLPLSEAVACLKVRPIPGLVMPTAPIKPRLENPDFKSLLTEANPVAIVRVISLFKTGADLEILHESTALPD